MTTDATTQEDSMCTATPTRAPHSDIPTGHKPAEGRVGAGLFDPKQLLKSLQDAFRGRWCGPGSSGSPTE